MALEGHPKERNGLDSFFKDRAFQAGLRASLAVLLVIGALVLIQYAWVIIQPLLISIVLATALWPWVARICSIPIGPRKWRIPRVVATAAIYLVSILMVGFVTWLTLVSLMPQVERVLQAYPQQTAFVRDYLEPFRAGDIAGGAALVAEEVAKEASRTQNGTQPQVDQSAGNAAQSPVSIGALAIGLFGGLITLGLVLLFTFFLLLDGDRFAQWMLMMLPRERRLDARYLGMQIRDRMSRWVLAHATYAMASAIIMGVGMWALQMPSPWLYGVAGALLAVIPGVGPGFAAVPAFVVALDLSAWQAVAVLAYGFVVYALDGTTLVPKIYGDTMRVPMFVVLFATMLGAILMGVWGAMIATPVAAALQMLIRDQFPGLKDQKDPTDAQAA